MVWVTKMGREEAFLSFYLWVTEKKRLIKENRKNNSAGQFFDVFSIV